VRIAAGILVLCALLGATSVFLPSFEVELGGITFGKRGSLSLYQANGNRDFLRKFVSGYHKSTSRRVGAAVVYALAPRLGNKLHLGDAKDAMDTLDGISDDDTKTASRVLTVTVWGFLLLQLVMTGLILKETVAGTYRRRRLLIALAIAAVLATVALALYMISKQAVFEANDELGHDFLQLGVGAQLIPFTALGSLGAMIALVVLQIRGARAAA